MEIFFLPFSEIPNLQNFQMSHQIHTQAFCECLNTYWLHGCPNETEGEFSPLRERWPVPCTSKKRKEKKREYIQPAGSSIFLLCHISLSILLSLEKNEMSGETIISHQPLWKSRHLKQFHWRGAFVYFCQIYRFYKMVFWAWYEALEACAEMKHLLLVERASYSLCFYHCSWAENQWASPPAYMWG